MVSAGWLTVGLNVIVLDEPISAFPFVHTYATLNVSLSASLAVAAQVNSVDVVTPVFGDTEIESTVGGVLPTMTDAEEVFDSPDVSVAVIVHATISVG